MSSLIPDSPVARPIADALVITACAYTSLARFDAFGLLDRDRPLFHRLLTRFPKLVYVSYGDASDAPIARSLAPIGYKGTIECVCNDEHLEPARFMAGVPGRVARLVGGCRSVLLKTDQFFGGDVAVTIASTLRSQAIRTGLLARAGYHWSWTEAREHGPDSPKAALASFIEAELCRAADVIVATTPRIVEDLAWAYQLPRAKCRVVPNFMLADRPPTPVSDREPGLVLFAGRLNREKRAHLIIESIAALPPHVKAATKLLILGQGPLEPDLRALAAKHNVNIEIRSRVPHREFLGLLHRCRVFMQCSEYEGHPKTILEAMCAGSPVLVTRAPGISEVIDEGQTALARSADPAQLACALEALLTDDRFASELGASAAATIRGQRSAPGITLDHTYPLLEAACEQAMALAGLGASMPAASVRWDQTLLNLQPSPAAHQFAASVGAYAKRLSPENREVFIDALIARVGGLSEMTSPLPPTPPPRASPAATSIA